MNDVMNDTMNNAMNKDASNDNANTTALRGNALLTDKVAIITGAAQGIGFACAARFGAEGAKVVLGDINCDAGEAAAKQLRERGIDARHQVCDVGRESSIDALLDFAEAAHGRIDCAIANAGIVKHVDPLTMSIDDFDAVLTVNLRGVVLTGQRAAQRMIRQPPDENGARGCIINMSSINALRCHPRNRAVHRRQRRRQSMDKMLGHSLGARRRARQCNRPRLDQHRNVSRHRRQPAKISRGAVAHADWPARRTG